MFKASGPADEVRAKVKASGLSQVVKDEVLNEIAGIKDRDGADVLVSVEADDDGARVALSESKVSSGASSPEQTDDTTPGTPTNPVPPADPNAPPDTQAHE